VSATVENISYFIAGYCSVYNMLNFVLIVINFNT
jgi:hypothetical protein